MLPHYQLFMAAAALLSMKVTTTVAAVIVTGVKVDPQAPSVPARQNIVQLHSTAGPQWDLYIQALGAMQTANATDPESYFQISGIHGMPFREYDNTGPRSADGWKGYCPHTEAIFLPWHRAHGTLFEQTLVDHAKKIALKYPEEHRARYIEAADTLRSPFWDWAIDEAVPQATVPQTLKINVAENGQLQEKEVENPLYTFKFPQAALAGELGEFDSEQKTQMYRCNGPGASYPESANALVKMRNYKVMLYDAFTKATDFSSFADKGQSLELIHGGIHWDATCGGQFLDLASTGFDPLFMLHHNNVDRMWAYWEALHPDQQLFSGEYPGNSRWGTPSNTMITTKSPLLPFRRNETEFHTPETVQSIYDLGYSYHGLEFRDSDPAKRREEVTRIVNGLQPQFARLNGRQSIQQPDRPRVMVTRYFAHISVELSEVERPCSIEMSMNETYAGNFVLLSMPASGVVHGEIALDCVSSTLQGKSNRDVQESLQSWLEVEILKGDGSKISLANVSSLGVEIEQVQVAVPRSDIELPQYSDSRKFDIRVGNKSS